MLKVNKKDIRRKSVKFDLISLLLTLNKCAVLLQCFCYWLLTDECALKLWYQLKTNYTHLNQGSIKLVDMGATHEVFKNEVFKWSIKKWSI